MGRWGCLAALWAACAMAQCPGRCQNMRACGPPTCGPACCRYWARQQLLAPPPASEDPGTEWHPHGLGAQYPPLVVLRRNSVYRVNDIVTQGGRRWRRDSIAVLVQPQYRGSVLQELLLRTSTLNGTRLDELGPTRRRRIWQRARSENQRTGLSGPSGIQFEPSLPKRIAALIGVLQERLQAGRCDSAPEDTAAVHLRLGDILDAPTRLRNTFDPHRIWGGAGFAALAGQLAPLCGAHIVLVSVLNFSPSGHMQANEGARPFSFSNASVERSLGVAAGLGRALRSCGFSHEWRSQPNPDADLCFLLSAASFVPSVGGLSSLLLTLRETAGRSQRSFRAMARATPAPTSCEARSRKCLLRATRRMPALHSHRRTTFGSRGRQTL